MATINITDPNVIRSLQASGMLDPSGVATNVLSSGAARGGNIQGLRTGNAIADLGIGLAEGIFDPFFRLGRVGQVALTGDEQERRNLQNFYFGEDSNLAEQALRGGIGVGSFFVPGVGAAGSLTNLATRGVLGGGLGALSAQNFLSEGVDAGGVLGGAILGGGLGAGIGIGGKALKGLRGGAGMADDLAQGLQRPEVVANYLDDGRVGGTLLDDVTKMSGGVQGELARGAGQPSMMMSGLMGDDVGRPALQRPGGLAELFRVGGDDAGTGLSRTSPYAPNQFFREDALRNLTPGQRFRFGDLIDDTKAPGLYSQIADTPVNVVDDLPRGAVASYSPTGNRIQINPDGTRAPMSLAHEAEHVLTNNRGGSGFLNNATPVRSDVTGDIIPTSWLDDPVERAAMRNLGKRIDLDNARPADLQQMLNTTPDLQSALLGDDLAQIRNAAALRRPPSFTGAGDDVVRAGGTLIDDLNRNAVAKNGVISVKDGGNRFRVVYGDGDIAFLGKDTLQQGGINNLDDLRGVLQPGGNTRIAQNADLAKMTTEQIRRNQQLVQQQIPEAFRQQNTRALAKLQAADDSYMQELLRRTDGGGDDLFRAGLTGAGGQPPLQQPASFADVADEVTARARSGLDMYPAGQTPDDMLLKSLQGDDIQYGALYGNNGRAVNPEFVRRTPKGVMEYLPDEEVWRPVADVNTLRGSGDDLVSQGLAGGDDLFRAGLTGMDDTGRVAGQQSTNRTLGQRMNRTLDDMELKQFKKRLGTPTTGEGGLRLFEDAKDAGILNIDDTVERAQEKVGAYLFEKGGTVSNEVSRLAQEGVSIDTSPIHQNFQELLERTTVDKARRPIEQAYEAFVQGTGGKKVVGIDELYNVRNQIAPFTQQTFGDGNVAKESAKQFNRVYGLINQNLDDAFTKAGRVNLVEANKGLNAAYRMQAFLDRAAGRNRGTTTFGVTDLLLGTGGFLGTGGNVVGATGAIAANQALKRGLVDRLAIKGGRVVANALDNVNIPQGGALGVAGNVLGTAGKAAGKVAGVATSPRGVSVLSSSLGRMAGGAQSPAGASAGISADDLLAQGLSPAEATEVVRQAEAQSGTMGSTTPEGQVVSNTGGGGNMLAQGLSPLETMAMFNDALGGTPQTIPLAMELADAYGGEIGMIQSQVPGLGAGGELSKEQVSAISGLQSIGDLRQVAGNFGTRLGAKIGLPTDETQLFNLAKRNLGDVLARLRTGAAINTVEERLYLETFMPNVLDTPQTIQKKLDQWENLLAMVAQRGSTGSEGTQEPSQGSAAGLFGGLF